MSCVWFDGPRDEDEDEDEDEDDDKSSLSDLEDAIEDEIASSGDED